MKDEERTLEERSLGCPLVGHQEAEVCLPITIKPFARTGPIRTRCCGPAVIRPGIRTCNGVKDGECSFTVTQKICVNIPILFGSRAVVGDTYVSCLRQSTGLDEDCEEDECEDECEDEREEECEEDEYEEDEREEDDCEEEDSE